jgi:hypothetical protein
MKRLAFPLIFLAIYLAPSLTHSGEEKCIKGDCVNGEGTMIYPDGSKYEGEWKDNKRDGFGIFIYPKGSKYMGYWERNKRSGLGAYNHYKGESYIGEWKNNKKHGVGKLVLNDGGEYLGEWKDDEIVSEISYFSYPDGSTYFGEISNHKRKEEN